MKHTRKIVLTFFLSAITCLGMYSQKNVDRDDEDYVENRYSTWGIEFDFSDLDPATVKINLLAAKLKRIKTYNDSVMNKLRLRNIKQRSDSLEQLYDLLAGDTTSSYNAYSFFAGQYHSTISALNKGLASLAWPKLPDMSYHITNFLDFTWKRRRIINDVFMSVGTAQSVSKGDISVSYTFKSPLNYNIGYCILDKKRVQFFPYIGLSYQSSELSFANTAVQPFDLKGSIYDTLVKAATVNKKGADYRFKKQDLIFNYGVELDLHVVYSKRGTGFIVGARAGGGVPFFSTGWRLDGSRYSQLNGVSIKDYYYDIVLRVYLRRNSQGGPYYLRNNWWESYN
jgi:hypothetical protein